MISLEPAGHRVLVKPLPLEEVSRGGIIIPTDERKEKAQVKGRLVKIGPNAWKAFDDGSAWAKEGDVVVYAQYGGFLVKDPETDEEYRILNDEDVVAIVRQEDAK